MMLLMKYAKWPGGTLKADIAARSKVCQCSNFDGIVTIMISRKEEWRRYCRSCTDISKKFLLSAEIMFTTLEATLAARWQRH